MGLCVRGELRKVFFAQSQILELFLAKFFFSLPLVKMMDYDVGLSYFPPKGAIDRWTDSCTAP